MFKEAYLDGPLSRTLMFGSSSAFPAISLVRNAVVAKLRDIVVTLLEPDAAANGLRTDILIAIIGRLRLKGKRKVSQWR
jgi:hypothetical protein